jgi:hypothetical protein
MEYLDAKAMSEAQKAASCISIITEKALGANLSGADEGVYSKGNNN